MKTPTSLDAAILAALIPPLILLIYIYRKDKVEREPVGLIIRLVLMGMLATFPAAIIEHLLIDNLLPGLLSPYSMTYLIVENVFCVALVEEWLKYLNLKNTTWKNRAFNYTFDGIVYAVSVSLGFAALENILYTMIYHSEYGIMIAVVRAFTAIPGHCVFAVYMGVYYGLAKKAEAMGNASRRQTYLRMAVIVPMILHGIYDTIASIEGTGIGTLLFYAYIIYLDVHAIRRINQMERADSRI